MTRFSYRSESFHAAKVRSGADDARPLARPPSDFGAGAGPAGAVARLPLHPSEGAAPAAALAGAPATSLAALLAGHILRDGEVVLLILKPSVWFIVLSSVRFVAAVLIAMIAAKLYDPAVPGLPRTYVEAGLLAIVARIMWAVLQWTARLYVLTDMRVVRISGVFGVNVFDCPLRRVARTRIVRTARERLLLLGSIEIIPEDPDAPDFLWQTVARPRAVHAEILTAIRRAKQNCNLM